MPSVLPMMTASPNPTPRTRRRPAGATEVMALFQRNENHVDGRAGVARRVARPARFEFDVARLPAIRLRLPVRGILDLAPGQMDDDRVGGVRVKALARTDLHSRAHHAHPVVLEEGLETHAGELPAARLRRGR